MSPSSDKPVLHYLDIGRLGRGEIVRLFLRDASIDFEDKRYPYDDSWPAASKKMQESGLSRTGSLPVLEYKGQLLSQHLPIIRYLARELNSYDGETSVEKHIVDVVSDIYVDWRAQWVANIKGPSEEFKNETVPKFYSIVAQYYDDRKGPYLLGERITYADFAIYHAIDNNERIGANSADHKLPASLLRLKETVEQRPRLSAYIAEGK